jgi:hypothetical protein
MRTATRSSACQRRRSSWRALPVYRLGASLGGQRSSWRFRLRPFGPPVSYSRSRGSPSRAGASARPAVLDTHRSVAATWEGVSPGGQWDLGKSRRDRFCPIPAISALAGVLRVPTRSQIARTRALFERFSEMSGNLETEVWSKLDLNSRPLPGLYRQNCPPDWPIISAKIKQQCWRESHRRKFASAF